MRWTGRRAVVTGIGLICPVAGSYRELVRALGDGTPGTGPIDVDGPLGDLAPLTVGSVPGAIVDRLLDGRPTSGSRFATLLLAAAGQALTDADWTTRGARDLFLLATTIGPGDVYEGLAGLPEGAPEARALASQQWLPSPMRTLLETFGLSGEAYTLSHGCSAASYGLAFAADAVREGRRDRALVAGVDTLSRVALVAYDRFGISGRRSQPFDRHRDGIVSSEGAAVLVVEEASAARRRGARIYAEIGAGCTTTDAHATLAPHPDGHALARAMRTTLAHSGVEAAEVGFVSACASGTPIGDRAEAKALRTLFPEAGTCPPIAAIKGQFGHAHGASSVLGAIAGIAAVREGVIPASVGLTEPCAEGAELDLLRPTGRRADVDVALCNATGFGSADSSLTIARWSGA